MDYIITEKEVSRLWDIKDRLDDLNKALRKADFTAIAYAADRIEVCANDVLDVAVLQESRDARRRS